MRVECPELSRIEAVLAVGIVVLLAGQQDDVELEALERSMEALGVAPTERPDLRRRMVELARNRGGVGLIGAARNTLQGPDVEYACELIARTLLTEDEAANDRSDMLWSLRDALRAS